MHYVKIIKSDRWSGREIELKTFLTKKEAMDFCADFNKDNDFTIPDYYEAAHYDERSKDETPEHIAQVRDIASRHNISVEDTHYLLKAFEGH